jgi:hypothetical protein
LSQEPNVFVKGSLLPLQRKESKETKTRQKQRAGSLRHGEKTIGEQ